MLKRVLRSNKILKNQKFYNTDLFDFNTNLQQPKKNFEQVEYPSPGFKKKKIKNQVLEDPFFGLSSQPFDEKINEILLSPVNPQDIEIKPDGILYLPEIKYRKG
jgi:hypothetical protein